MFRQFILLFLSGFGVVSFSTLTLRADNVYVNPIECDSLVSLAAVNIAGLVGHPVSGIVQVICTSDKRVVAESVTQVLKERNLRTRLECLDGSPESCNAGLANILKGFKAGDGLVLLLDPVVAPTLFELVGRPDKGLKMDSIHLFCDWLIPVESLIRTFGVNKNELEIFRGKLLAALDGAKEIRITSEAGTDITVVPRNWIQTDGEVFTAPLEAQSRGKIVVDGCAYDGPPEQPFTLLIESGKVMNLAHLDSTIKRQRWVIKDLARDAGSTVLAELGIGINPGASPDANIMEAEQARGTVHFGFGHNLEYGGTNESGGHIDYMILKPTIIVDGKIVCRCGRFSF